MKKFVIMILCSALCIGLGACNNSNGNRPSSVTINCYSGNYVSATTQIIRHDNLLEKYLPENITVNYTEIVSGPDIRDALLAGDVQIADLALINFQAGLENDLPLTLISFCGSTPINLYSNREDVAVLQDFSGNEQITITNRATNLHAAYLAAVKENGLDVAAYDKMLVATPNTEALALLENGNTIAGSTLSFPTYTKAEGMEGVHLVCDMTDVIQSYSIGSAFITTSDFYNENPEIIAAFRSAQDEALKILAERPEYVAEFLTELYGINYADVLSVLQKLPPTKSLAGYDRHAELLYEAGILTEPPAKFSELPNYEDIAVLGG